VGKGEGAAAGCAPSRAGVGPEQDQVASANSFWRRRTTNRRA
jgi:hypothetical protein